MWYSNQSHTWSHTQKRHNIALCSQMETLHGKKQQTHLQSKPKWLQLSTFFPGVLSHISPLNWSYLRFIAAVFSSSVTKSIEVKVSCQPWMLSGWAEQNESQPPWIGGKTVHQDDLSQDRSTERKAPEKKFYVSFMFKFWNFCSARVKSGSCSTQEIEQMAVKWSEMLSLALCVYVWVGD